MIKSLWMRFRAEIAFAALVGAGLLLLNAVFTGTSLLPEPKLEPTVTPNPLQHGGLRNATDTGDESCNTEFIIAPPNIIDDWAMLFISEHPVMAEVENFYLIDVQWYYDGKLWLWMIFSRTNPALGEVKDTKVLKLQVPYVCDDGPHFIYEGDLN